MSVEPKEMVSYAHGLLHVDNSELELRNVINRAYYGAFLTARDAASIDNSSASVHHDVISHYQRRNPRIGSRLDDLKRMRQKADYRPDQDVSPREAKKCCTQARGVLNDLNV